MAVQSDAKQKAGRASRHTQAARSGPAKPIAKTKANMSCASSGSVPPQQSETRSQTESTGRYMKIPGHPLNSIYHIGMKRQGNWLETRPWAPPESIGRPADFPVARRRSGASNRESAGAGRGPRQAGSRPAEQHGNELAYQGREDRRNDRGKLGKELHRGQIATNIKHVPGTPLGAVEERLRARPRAQRAAL